MTGSRVVTGAQPITVTSISAFVGPVGTAPQYSLAIYSDAAGRPLSLVAQAANGTLQGNAWNTLPISTMLSASTAYWLMYNANGPSSSLNDLFYNSDPAMVGGWNAQTFGTWPAAFGPSTLAGQRYSIYVSGTTSNSPPPTVTPTPTATSSPTSTPTGLPAPTNTPTPTPGGSSTTLGQTTLGSVVDMADSNWMTGSRVVTPTQALTVTSITVYVGGVSPAPNNQFGVAIYSDSGGAPATRVAQYANGTLQANAWNTLAISASLSPNTAYWLMYNANGSISSMDNMVYTTDPSMVGAWTAQTFGTWPASFGSSTLAGQRYSIYATAH